MSHSMRHVGTVTLLTLAAVGCREGGTAQDTSKPELAAACVTYLDRAAQCGASQTGKAKDALDAVYAANKTTIDAADTPPKMESVEKQCGIWSEMLAKHPLCGGGAPAPSVEASTGASAPSAPPSAEP